MGGLYSFLKCLVESTSEASDPGFFVGDFGILTISLLVIGQCRFSISLWFNLDDFMFLGIYPYILGDSVCCGPFLLTYTSFLFFGF